MKNHKKIISSPLNNIKTSKLPKLMMIKSINFSININNNNSNNIKNKIKSLYLGIIHLNNILSQIILKLKTSFYVNLISFYFDIKDNINYINLRKLLSNILLKKIITKKCGVLKYYFLN